MESRRCFQGMGMAVAYQAMGHPPSSSKRTLAHVAFRRGEALATVNISPVESRTRGLVPRTRVAAAPSQERAWLRFRIGRGAVALLARAGCLPRKRHRRRLPVQKSDQFRVIEPGGDQGPVSSRHEPSGQESWVAVDLGV